jgi:hypothetical protein
VFFAQRGLSATKIKKSSLQLPRPITLCPITLIEISTPPPVNLQIWRRLRLRIERGILPRTDVLEGSACALAKFYAYSVDKSEQA